MSYTYTQLGLSEQELREQFAQELARARQVEEMTDAIAHAFARVVELDHLRVAAQLEAAGVRLQPADTG